MSEEIFPIVDELGNVTGFATRTECHSGSKQLHPVVHLHLFNSRGELYLQHRPITKDIQPDRWDTAVGGHVGYGEKVEVALAREAKEELGISRFDPAFAYSYTFESEIERELVYTYTCIYDGTITPDTEELDGGRFWRMDEIEASLGKNVFTPNFEGEYEKLKQHGIILE